MTGRLGIIGRAFRAIGDLLPEREFHYRARGKVRYFSISRRAQIGLVSLFCLLVGWTVFSTFYFVTFDHVLRGKTIEVAQSRKAQKALLEEVGQFNERLQIVTETLERSRSDLMRLAGRGTPDGDGTGLSVEDRERMARSQDALKAQITVLSKSWSEINKRSNSIESGLKSIGSEVESILGEHEQVKRERNVLRRRVAALQRELADVRGVHARLATELDERTKIGIEEMERVIAMTGLDSNKLIAEVSNGGQGGPRNEILIAGGPEDELGQRVATLQSRMERWQHLQQVMRRLPLIAPLDHYRLSSGFGRRRDPITGRWAEHNGLDFAYHMNTPVLVTAPGTVVFAGWRGAYGWMVEIDHGMGVRTRYAHLRKILVANGQKVAFREKIGLLGTSGRSTGPHVHYEILVDGKAQDPMNFITAGKYVFKG